MHPFNETICSDGLPSYASSALLSMEHTILRTAEYLRIAIGVGIVARCRRAGQLEACLLLEQHRAVRAAEQEVSELVALLDLRTGTTPSAK